MSYSLVTPCYGCKKETECSDAAVLSGAVQGIHMTGSHRGHKGYGMVRLECGGKETEPENNTSQ